MAEKPIFPDCQRQDDCECAKRGYEHERDTCAVPHVEAAVAMLGIDTSGLTGARLPDRRLFQRPRLTQVPDRFGTVQPLADTGDLNDDIFQALRAVAGNVPLKPEAIGRIMQMNGIARGLRAEAGMMSSSVVFFCTKHAMLANGGQVLAWLTLAHVDVGDALYWMVAVKRGGSESPCSLHIARPELLDDAIELLAHTAGGMDGELKTVWEEAPTEDEIAAAAAS